jgi:hypothetical protein
LHSYGTEFKFTPHLHIGLAVLSYGLYEIVTLLPLPQAVAVHPFFALTIFGFVELLFTQWGWRLLCYVPALGLHYFGGTYEGPIRSGDGSEFPAKLTIKQTWSKIELYFESGQASSKSISASIIPDRLQKGSIEVAYNYYAPGVRDVTGAERVGAHYGTAMLRRLESGALLDGEYFTEQKRHSNGRMCLRRTP